MLLSSLLRLPQQQPLAFGIAVSALKTSAADALAQLRLEQRQRMDWRRNGLFFAWGALYLGGVQYFIYVHLFARVLFPSAAVFIAKPLSGTLCHCVPLLTAICRQLGVWSSPAQRVHLPAIEYQSTRPVLLLNREDANLAPGRI